GSIIENAQTYWSGERDGNIVVKGGAQAMLAEKASRSIYVINKAQSRLDNFTRSNLESIAGSASTLISDLQVTDSAAVDSLINWTRGVDVDDED
ncbi:hypothetical protein, partial [Aeromonas allosaccharophila]